MAVTRPSPEFRRDKKNYVNRYVKQEGAGIEENWSCWRHLHVGWPELVSLPPPKQDYRSGEPTPATPREPQGTLFGWLAILFRICCIILILIGMTLQSHLCTGFQNPLLGPSPDHLIICSVGCLGAESFQEHRLLTAGENLFATYDPITRYNI